MNLTLASNWKMNPESIDQAVLLAKFYNNLNLPKNLELLTFTPDLYLNTLKKEFPDLQIGSQNVSSKISGSYTGQSSVKMLESMDVNTVLIGHSEVRKYYSQTDTDIAEVVEQVINSGFKAVLCIGFENNFTVGKLDVSVLDEQLTQALSKVLDKANSENLVIAYEPVWAINSGNPASPEIVAEAVVAIQSRLKILLGQHSQAQIPILYGGSVDSTNLVKFLDLMVLDGFLIGKASLSTSEMLKIVESIVFWLDKR
jgi:triosephosphate isomerase (TIM)